MRVAIVGSGVSGLTAAFLLRNHFHVEVFEKESWLGGHTHTMTISEDERHLDIDTGFIVFNDKTYPNFNKLLNNLKIKRIPTSMSFSVSNLNSGLEFNGTNLSGIFAQRKNLVNIKFLWMLIQLLKFNKQAKNLNETDANLSLLAYINKHKISANLVENYLLPMCCSIWSCPADQMMQTPVRFLFDFFNNHGMLNINDRPQWFVVKGGSHAYVKAIESLNNIQFHKVCAVVAVKRLESHIQLETSQGTKAFDYVVFATHADTTLQLLSNPSFLEHEALSAFRFQKNDVVLHTDTSVMPTNKRAWAAWNFKVINSHKNLHQLAYNMNILQGFHSKKTYCVSVNQSCSIDPNKVLHTFKYDHPVFDKKACTAQKKHLDISGKDRIFYCGAYWRNGFHEDGVFSALHIGKQLCQTSL